MTIAASGPLRLAALRTEYVGPAVSRLWRDYKRGTAYVRANAGDNTAVNNSASIPTTGPIRLSAYRGKAKGWTFTNAGTLVTPGNHNYIHIPFGSDWSGNNWPKTYVNNGVMGSNSVSFYPCVIQGGLGQIDFINNSEVQGAGGGINSAVGQHALVITATSTKPRVTNNGAIRGGGGGGGHGGQGGTGGQGTYVYTAQDGPAYSPDNYELRISPGGSNGIVRIWWAASLLYYQYAPPFSGIAVGAYTYYNGSRMDGGGSTAQYEVYRQYAANAYTAGGAGGAGGNGGIGIGYASPNTGGAGGAAGAAGGTNAGSGGIGGTGGTGGSWGQPGNNGNTGATGNTGNYTGGAAGSIGNNGGAAGQAVYADSPWSLLVGGSLFGGSSTPVSPS